MMANPRLRRTRHTTLTLCEMPPEGRDESCSSPQHERHGREKNRVFAREHRVQTDVRRERQGPRRSVRSVRGQRLVSTRRTCPRRRACGASVRGWDFSRDRETSRRDARARSTITSISAARSPSSRRSSTRFMNMDFATKFQTPSRGTELGERRGGETSLGSRSEYREMDMSDGPGLAGKSGTMSPYKKNQGCGTKHYAPNSRKLV